MANRFDRIAKSIPQYFQPLSNKNWKGFLTAFADEFDRMDTQTENAKEQIFVKTAVSNYLDLLGSNVGVNRVTIIKFIDESFRQLIPILSFYPKQIRPSMYAALSLFFPIYYMHASQVSTSFEPYNFAGGERLFLQVDGKKSLDVSFIIQDFKDNTAATAQEVVDKINEWLPESVKAFVYFDQIANKKYVGISTNTFGLSGSLKITGGTANSILNFSTLISQYVKVSLEEINPNEIVVRIPKELIIQNDDLRWSHYFHPNSTIIDSRPLIDSTHPYWPGNFFYDFQHGSSIGLFSIQALLQTNITKGSHYVTLTFNDVSHFPANGGYLVFHFGNSNEEKSVKYFTRINNTQLKIDAAHSFQFDHAINEPVNLMQLTPVVPKITGEDHAIYFTDTGISKLIAQTLLLLLKAAGIIVRFEISE